MRNKIDYGNNMLCTQLLWAEWTDRCCCTTISDAEYEKDRCRIANAYIRGGRIANPTEQRRIWMALNLMGDPEMPVYMSKPKTFQNVSIEFVNDSVYVDTGIDGFDICFINQTDSTDYYIARNIESSSVSFGGLDGIYNVCISKPGYIPYTSVCGDLYLQNITITGSKTYTANSVIIGSNVTDKVYQGPVTVSSGTTTIKASEGSTITRDFEVEQGAQFIITNQ